MTFLAFFAGTDLRIDFLAVWTKNFQVEGPDTGENLASIVYTVLSELDIGAKLLQLLHRDNAKFSWILSMGSPRVRTVYRL
jgi:hypothetical protein